MMTSDPQSKAELLTKYRELLRIAKDRPEGILTQSETNQLITHLEKCIEEIETAHDVEKTELTG